MQGNFLMTRVRPHAQNRPARACYKRPILLPKRVSPSKTSDAWPPSYSIITWRKSGGWASCAGLRATVAYTCLASRRPMKHATMSNQ